MRTLRRHVFIPLFDRIVGDKRLKYMPEITREYCDYTNNEVESIQVKRFWSLARTAYVSCPFYRKLYEKAGVNPFDMTTKEDISKIPIISKDDIYMNGDQMLNPQYPLSSLRKSATGGTTAAPITFYLTQDAWSRRRAATLYFRKWFGYRPGDPQAFLWGAPQDFPDGLNWKWKLGNFLSDNSLMIFSSYLNDDVLDDVCKKLDHFKPVTLQGYSTPLAILAEYMLRKKIFLDIPNINATAEPLYENQRKVIEEAFNVGVYTWYGARELGHVATECSAHDGLHLNMWGTLVETVVNDEPVCGKMGDFVVTELYNDAMPLIRYRIGDLGIITHQECSCGFPTPRIQKILGRVGDVFRLRDGTYIPGISFADRVITDSTSIAHLQVIQKDYELIELVIVKGKNFTKDTVEEVKHTITNYLKFKPQFIIRYVEAIPRESSGKIRFIKNEMPHNTGTAAGGGNNCFL